MVMVAAAGQVAGMTPLLRLAEEELRGPVGGLKVRGNRMRPLRHYTWVLVAVMAAAVLRVTSCRGSMCIVSQWISLGRMRAVAQQH